MMKLPQKSFVAKNPQDAQNYEKPTSRYTCSNEFRQFCKIFVMVIMTLSFVTIKIFCFRMFYKFAFQEEENLFGFPVKMFKFTKTYWANQYNKTEE